MNLLPELKNMGIRFSKKQGQCLLVRSEIMDQIGDAAELTGEELVIDIGTGPAHLVKYIAPRCRWYVGIELDARLISVAREKTADLENCTIIHADVLKKKRKLNPEVIEQLKALIAEKSITSVKLVANLPYHVSVPVIIGFLAQSDIKLDCMVVMVQREIAGKLRANHGTAHYKALAVQCGVLADTESIMFVSKDSFFPAPDVESAVIKLIPIPDDEMVIPKDEIQKFITFSKSVFNFPKKNLVNSIKHSHITELTKPELETKLTEIGLDPFRPIAGVTIREFTDIFKAFLGKG